MSIFNIAINPADDFVKLWQFVTGELRRFQGTDRAVMMRSLIAGMEYELPKNKIKLNCVILNFEQHFNRKLSGVKFHES